MVIWLLQVPVFEMGVDAKPAEIARQGLAKARAEDYDAVIVDTAGRLQVSSAPHMFLYHLQMRPARDGYNTERIMLFENL